MKMKKLTAALCAVVLAAGMAGVPAVGELTRLGTFVSASAEDMIVLGGTYIPKEEDFEFDGDIGYKMLDDGTVEIGYYKGTAKELTIPSNINGKIVTSIGSLAFDDNDTLISITIPNSIKYIDITAFPNSLKTIIVNDGNSNYSSVDGVLYNKNATELLYCPGAKEKVIIPNSVTGIGKNAFAGCTSLTSVTIPDSITSIGNSAFAGCARLTSVTIPNGVTNIDRHAFFECRSLTSISIPNSVISIGVEAFGGCKSLTSVTIPNSVTNICDRTFSDCYSLTSVSIPNSVTSIGLAAFSDCKSLTSVTIPNSVTSIGRFAFSDCQSLTSVTIPNSVTEIGEKAFGYFESDYEFVKDSSFKIYCYSGTAGEEYAKDNEFDYVLLDAAAKTEISKTTAKFSSTKISYSGKSKMPKLTVTYGGKTLVKGTDYKVSGKNCKNPGKATITITGIGNYTGKKTMYFYIVPQKPTLTKATSTAKKKITLAWKKDPLADGYQIVVYSDKGCTKKVKSVLVKKNSTVKGGISGFTSGKTYYVRMRAYKTIDGKKQAGAFCAVKTVKVK